jgi:hypothetical protein
VRSDQRRGGLVGSAPREVEMAVALASNPARKWLSSDQIGQEDQGGGVACRTSSLEEERWHGGERHEGGWWWWRSAAFKRHDGGGMGKVGLVLCAPRGSRDGEGFPA